jgi:hypothetical protein
MKKFICHILLLFVVCFLCSRCKHEPEPESSGEGCGEATTIDEMMEWVYFKVGTYWVYQEQNTGVLDTVEVYYDYNGVHPEGFRDFVMKTRSSFDGYTYEYWFNDGWSGDCSLIPGCFCRAIECDKYIPGDYAGGNRVFVFPLRIGNQAGQIGSTSNYGRSLITSRLYSVSWGDHTFYNVYEFNQDYSPQHDYDSSIYRLCKNIGIIEKEIETQNEHWRLVEYRIEQ